VADSEITGGGAPLDLAISVRVRLTRWDGTLECYQQGFLVGQPLNSVVGPDGMVQGELQGRYAFNPAGIVIELSEPGNDLPVVKGFILLERPADPNTDQVDLNFGVYPVHLPPHPVPSQLA